MSTNLSLDVQIRAVTGKKVKYLRHEGLIPATVYGKGFDPVSVQVDERTFQTVYRKAGRSALIDLNIPGYPRQSAFVHDIQRHPVSRSIIHADFRVVDLRVAITTEIPVILTGKSLLVERGDAILNHALTHLTVHALPANLPPHLDIDISELDSFDKHIYVRDLPPSATYEIVTDAEELVVSLTQVRAVVEEEAEAAPASEPELIRKEQEENE